MYCSVKRNTRVFTNNALFMAYQDLVLSDDRAVFERDIRADWL